MSRAYNARRKAKRRQSRTERDTVADARFSKPPRLAVLAPVAVIVAILAIVGILGFGGNSRINRKQIRSEVTALLSGIPQHGSTLGSAKAPMTLWVFADLECPTVKRFVTAFLPSIIKTWVRDGTMKLEYRSLETDTYDEETFFEQESGALAAGRQNKLWNYALTFIHEQGQKQTGYATDAFLAEIASQVPRLSRARWQHDRKDPLLSKQVALELHSAYAEGLQYTPSFLLEFSRTVGGQTLSGGTDPVREEVESSLRATVTALREEASNDAPTLGFFGAQARNLGEIEAP